MGVRSRSGTTRDAALPDSGHPVVLEQRFRFLEPVQEQKSEGFSHFQGLILFWQHVAIKTVSHFLLSFLIFMANYSKVFNYSTEKELLLVHEHFMIIGLKMFIYYKISMISHLFILNYYITINWIESFYPFIKYPQII